MSTQILTASQTVGPFFSPCLLRKDALRNVLVQPETVGERIRIEGRVLDGDGIAIPDAMIEIWQADADGHYNHNADQAMADPTFLGFGRSGTEDAHGYWFETIKPGPVPFNIGRMQAPHISVSLFARGLLNHLVTRLYFADEPTNAHDPVLQCVPHDRQTTLLATPETRGTTVVYTFDIILQGAGETAFFNV